MSAKRTPQQTETAKFWLMVGPPAYHPVARQIALARAMNVADSARFMALYSAALTDAYIAVFDAKYHYEFWRPVTAIRNGDIDGNPDTAPDPVWQPLDATPMHPEYPCAHCIESGAAVGVVEAVLGSADIPEVTLTSSTAPELRIGGRISRPSPTRSPKRASAPASTTDSRPGSARIWAGRSAPTSPRTSCSRLTS